MEVDAAPTFTVSHPTRLQQVHCVERRRLRVVLAGKQKEVAKPSARAFFVGSRARGLACGRDAALSLSLSRARYPPMMATPPHQFTLPTGAKFPTTGYRMRPVREVTIRALDAGDEVESTIKWLLAAIDEDVPTYELLAGGTGVLIGTHAAFTRGGRLVALLFTVGSRGVAFGVPAYPHAAAFFNALRELEDAPAALHPSFIACGTRHPVKFMEAAEVARLGAAITGAAPGAALPALFAGGVDDRFPHIAQRMAPTELAAGDTEAAAMGEDWVPSPASAWLRAGVKLLWASCALSNLTLTQDPNDVAEDWDPVSAAMVLAINMSIRLKCGAAEPVRGWRHAAHGGDGSRHGGGGAGGGAPHAAAAPAAAASAPLRDHDLPSSAPARELLMAALAGALPAAAAAAGGAAAPPRAPALASPARAHGLTAAATAATAAFDESAALLITVVPTPGRMTAPAPTPMPLDISPLRNAAHWHASIGKLLVRLAFNRHEGTIATHVKVSRVGQALNKADRPSGFRHDLRELLSAAGFAVCNVNQDVAVPLELLEGNDGAALLLPPKLTPAERHRWRGILGDAIARCADGGSQAMLTDVAAALRHAPRYPAAFEHNLPGLLRACGFWVHDHGRHSITALYRPW